MYNVGTGRATTIHELAASLAKIYGRPELEPVYRGTYRPGDVRHLVLDSTCLRVLGWRATIPLAEGLSRFVEWVRRQDQVPERFRAAEPQLVASGVVRLSQAG